MMMLDAIMRGPHKKTLLAGPGNPPLIEIEPMLFVRVRRDQATGLCRAARVRGAKA